MIKICLNYIYIIYIMFLQIINYLEVIIKFISMFLSMKWDIETIKKQTGVQIDTLIFLGAIIVGFIMGYTNQNFPQYTASVVETKCIAHQDRV